MLTETQPTALIGDIVDFGCFTVGCEPRAEMGVSGGCPGNLAVAKYGWQPDRFDVDATCSGLADVRAEGIDDGNDAEQSPLHRALSIKVSITSANRNAMHLHLRLLDHAAAPADHLLRVKRQPTFAPLYGVPEIVDRQLFRHLLFLQ